MQQNCWKTMLLKKRIWAVNQKLHNKTQTELQIGVPFFAVQIDRIVIL